MFKNWHNFRLPPLHLQDFMTSERRRLAAEKDQHLLSWSTSLTTKKLHKNADDVLRPLYYSLHTRHSWRLGWATAKSTAGASVWEIWHESKLLLERQMQAYTSLLKGYFSQKWRFCHHLLILVSFQTLYFFCGTQVEMFSWVFMLLYFIIEKLYSFMEFYSLIFKFRLQFYILFGINSNPGSEL